MAKRGKKSPQSNSVTKLHSLWRIGALPRDVGVHHIAVEHDDWCGVFQGKRCDCDPTITLRWSQPAASQN